MRKSYPSDISKEQFEHILPILESARKKTKPRTVDLYDVFCGLLYILRTGCQWRQLPHDFPKWRTLFKAFFDVGFVAVGGDGAFAGDEFEWIECGDVIDHICVDVV